MKPNLRKVVASTLISLLAGFLIGVIFKNIYEIIFFKAYHWGTAPDVVNCYGDELREATIHRAVHYWAIRGESFSGRIYSLTPEECDSIDPVGKIIIIKDENIDKVDTLASTQRHSRFVEIRWATIKVRPGSQNLELLMEHEIGHAIGYGHVEETGHIMNPSYENMGDKFWIP